MKIQYPIWLVFHKQYIFYVNYSKITFQKDKIEEAKNKTKNKEDKEKLYEGEEEEEVEEEETSEVEVWQEQLRDIEKVLNENKGKLPDEYVVRLMKQYLLKNNFQNQGYVLDGYPKTIQQAKELFGQAAEAGVEEVPEEGGAQQENILTGNAPDKTLPHFIISLEAPDHFLCERIMALPESEIQVYINNTTWP